jgi:hypothetical protein
MDTTAYLFPALLNEPAPRVAQRKPSALRSLMDYYESNEEREDEESDVDLMIQLSGMVGGVATSAENV